MANNPRARLSEQIDAALYVNHPYGRPVIGWRPEIEKLNGYQLVLPDVNEDLEFYVASGPFRSSGSPT